MGAKRSTTRRSIFGPGAAGGGAIVVAGVLTASSGAFPVQGRFLDDPRCEPLPPYLLYEELVDVGLYPPTPPQEQIAVQTLPIGMYACVPDDGLPNDWMVRMTNLTGRPLMDLFFVADEGYAIGNSDGIAEDFNAAGIFTDAFKIDALGGHKPLVSEDLIVNNVFEPGETWEFLVTNFIEPGMLPGMGPMLGSPGFAGASPDPVPPQLSNASIVLGEMIPEPGSALMLGVAGGLLGLRRRGR